MLKPNVANEFPRQARDRSFACRFALRDPVSLSTTNDIRAVVGRTCIPGTTKVNHGQLHIGRLARGKCLFGNDALALQRPLNRRLKKRNERDSKYVSMDTGQKYCRLVPGGRRGSKEVPSRRNGLSYGEIVGIVVAVMDCQ